MKKRDLFILCCIFVLLCTSCDTKTGSGKNNTGLYNVDAGLYHPDTDYAEMPYDYSANLRLWNRIICDAGPFVLINYLQYDIGGGQRPALCEYDKASGEFDYLCKDAKCSHNINDDKCYACPSAVYAFSTVEFYDGKIYLEKRPQEPYDLPRNPSPEEIFLNHNTRDIVEIDGGVVEKYIGDASNKGFFHGSRGFYAYSPDMSLLFFDDKKSPPEILFDGDINGYTTGYFNIEHYVMEIDGFLYKSHYYSLLTRYNLSTGQIEELTDFGKPRQIVLVDGNKLYYTGYTGTNKNILYRCDFDGGNAEYVTDNVTSLWITTTFDDDYIYFIYANSDNPRDERNGTLHRVSKDLSAEPEQLGAEIGLKIGEYGFASMFTNPLLSGIYSVVGLDLLFLQHKSESDAIDYDWYTIRKDGTDLKKLEFR